VEEAGPTRLNVKRRNRTVKWSFKPIFSSQRPPAKIIEKKLKRLNGTAVKSAYISSFMKNTLITSALVAILGFALAGVPVTAQAQTPAPATTTASPDATATAPVKAKKAKKTAPVAYKGSITAIDASSVTVAGTSKTLTLAIAPTTKYLKDKKTATLADFAVGDAVTGSYTTDATGAMTAYSLHKKSAKTAAAAPATPAAQ
jgi:hypothetical protein